MRTWSMVCAVSLLSLVVAGQLRSQQQPEDSPSTLPKTPPEGNRTRGPRLTVDRDSVDLGVVREGGVYDFSFRLTNEGDRLLTITKIRSSCGCAVTSLPKRQLDAGESVDLSASFHSKGRAGKQRKRITIHSDDPARPTLTLTFEANVETLYKLSSRFLSFQNKRRGDPIERKVDLLAGKPGLDIEITHVELDKPGLSYTTEPIEVNGFRGHRFSFRLDETVPIGSYATSATIRIRSASEEAEVKLPIQGRVVADINVFPQMMLSMSAGALLPGEHLPHGRITLQAINPQRPFEVLYVETGQQLRYELEETTEGLEYRIELSVAPTALPGPSAGTVTILTNHPEQAVITVPFYMNIASPIEVRPEMVYLLRAAGDSTRSSELVTLSCPTLPHCRIEGASCDNPNIVVTRVSKSEGTQQLRIALADQAPLGQHRGNVTVHTDAERSVSVRVFAEVRE